MTAPVAAASCAVRANEGTFCFKRTGYTTRREEGELIVIVVVAPPPRRLDGSCSKNRASAPFVASAAANAAEGARNRLRIAAEALVQAQRRSRGCCRPSS